MTVPGQPLPPCPHCGAAHSEELLVCPATNQMLPLEGRVLDRRFRLVKMLGEGGMSTVWMAENVRVHKHVAIKLMHPEFARNPRTLHRFQNEATSAGRIGNPHICDILDFGECPLGPYMVMEMLRGQSFAELLQSQGKLEPPLAVLIIREALKGLGAAHAVSIIHRDLKPENLFIHEPEPGRMLVKLMDFGISKFSEEIGGGKTGANVIMGTPEYMSPEQAAGAANVDARTDIWAMGVMLYRALAGTEPFKGKTMAALLVALSVETPLPLASFDPTLPPGLVAIVDRCLNKRPEDRFASTQELYDALAPYEQMVAAGERPAAPPIQSGKTISIEIDPMTRSGLTSAGASAPADPQLHGQTVISGPPPGADPTSQWATQASSSSPPAVSSAGPTPVSSPPSSASPREGQTWSAELNPRGQHDDTWTTGQQLVRDDGETGHSRPQSRSWIGWVIGVAVVGLLVGGAAWAWSAGMLGGNRNGKPADSVAVVEAEEASADGTTSVADTGTAAETGSESTGAGSTSGASTTGGSGEESSTTGEPATGSESGEDDGASSVSTSGDSTSGGSTSGDSTGGDSTGGGSTSGGSTSGGSTGGGSTGGGSTSGGDGGDDGDDGGSSEPAIQLSKLHRIGSLYTPKETGPSGTYSSAKSYCSKLRNNKKYGLSKWRMATASEALQFKAAIDKTQYWTSETEGSTAKAVNVLNGRATMKPQSETARAFCVSKR